VAGRAIADYLRTLTFPPENYDIEGNRLAGYVEDQIRADELTDWTVFVATGSHTEVQLGGRRFGSIKRNPLPDRSTTTRFIVKSILNPPDEAIDLTADEYAEALRQTNDARRLSGAAETDRPLARAFAPFEAGVPRTGCSSSIRLIPSSRRSARTGRSWASS
jgi:hypothetical protein